jgi:anti-anti-sigma factor
MSSKHGAHWLERMDHGPVTVARLKTPANPDDDTLRAVFELITKLVSTVGRNLLVLNLGVADFLPSMALGKLVMLNRVIQSAGGRLTLCDVSTDVRESLERTRLLGLFNVYATEAEAVASYESR